MTTLSEQQEHLPIHVGIIMDGNGRWATRQGLPRNAGHKKGAKVFENISKHALDIGIRHLTVYAFSTENFKRPADEVDAIIDLMRSYLKDQKKNQNENVRIRFLGDISVLPADMKEDIRELESSSAHFDTLNLNIAFNYGGRADILRAAKQIAQDYKAGTLKELSDVSESDFSEYLYTKGQPDVDLIIRTSGEERISNFLIWQAAYAEYVFTPVLWPDFSPSHFDEALEIYKTRHRRLGGL